MSKRQMIVNYVPGEECRVAVVVDGRLEELHSESAASASYVGNIYVGRVTNVEPSIQAAFIDFGRDTNGFLHISDVHPKYFPGEEVTERIGKKTPRRERPPIQGCLKRGQEVIVQVLKEGINTKGPTLTSYLSIPGRYLVMLPWMDKVGVSRRVEDDDRRREMRKVLDTLELPDNFGFILRTAGFGRNKAELKRDLAYLQRLWKDIEKRRKDGRSPRLLYAESDLLIRALRDVWTSDIDEIIIDDTDALQRAHAFMKIVSPRSNTRLLHYDQHTPVFHAFGLEEQILRMHAREVPLPSGGSLVIDETEAMIAIDVNSGRMRSNKDAETTAFNTNKEAVVEICRQLRLRDLGGLIVCDLIDMMKRSNRRTIEQLFRDQLKFDRAASKALPISQFGMVELTRQRVRGSRRSTHFVRCPNCHGKGVLQRPDSVVADMLRDLGALVEQQKVHRVEVVVSPAVASVLLSQRRQALNTIESRSKKQVTVRISEDIIADRIVFYAYDASGSDLEISRLPQPKPPRNLKEWKPSRQREDWAVDPNEEAEAIEEDQADEETEAGARDSTPDTTDEQEQTGKKRRRRGRRGGRRHRKRAGDEQEDADAQNDDQKADSKKDEPSGAEAEAKPDKKTAPKAKESRDETATDDGAPKKKRRRGRRGGRKRKKTDAGAAPEAADDAPDPSKPDEASEPKDAEKTPEPVKREDRIRKSDIEHDSKDTRDEKPQKDAGGSGKTSKRKTSRKRSTKKKTKSASAGDAKDDTPTGKGSKPQDRGGKDAPGTDAETNGAPAKEPRRSLYGGARRRLKPSEALTRRNDESN